MQNCSWDSNVMLKCTRCVRRIEGSTLYGINNISMLATRETEREFFSFLQHFHSSTFFSSGERIEDDLSDCISDRFIIVGLPRASTSTYTKHSKTKGRENLSRSTMIFECKYRKKREIGICYDNVILLQINKKREVSNTLESKKSVQYV